MSLEKKALITAAGPNMLPILKDHTLPAFNNFAEAHDYKVGVETLFEDDLTRKGEKAKQARWQKISLLRKTLANNDVAAWFDADVLICRDDEDVADHLGDKDFQAFTMHSVPTERRINPNTGVWVMRNCSEAFEFLDEVEEIGMPEGRWSDQGAVMKGLNWVMGDENYHNARPGLGNNFLLGTAWLPTGWNQPYIGDGRSSPENYVGRPTVEEPHAIHFMGMTIDERKMVMGAVMSEVLERRAERTQADRASLQPAV